MPRITILRRKFSFSFLAFVVVLLTIGSIAFGTVTSSANPNDGEKSREENSFLANLQSEKMVGNFLAAKEFLFPKNSEPTSSASSTFVVNSSDDTNDVAPGDGVCADSAGNCTLRAAIQEANATAGTGEITFNFDAPTTIQLNSGFSPAELVITEGVTITGPGARLLTVSGNSNTISGVFNINASATTTSVSGITVANSGGRGINNDGKLNLSDIAVSGNQYGIYNTGKLDLTRATVSGNSSGGLYISASSSVNISNTTITSNTSANNGGGIFTASSDVTLNNVTISHNTAGTSGGGLYYNGASAGVYVRNTIIADNTAPSGADIFSANNLTGANFVSRGNNLIGKSDVNTGFIQGVNADQVGTIATPIDPLLGPLQNNGGQTDTRAIQSASPAKDAGNVCVVNSSCGSNNPSASLLTDQRGTGFPRNYQAGVDIGAFELFYPKASISSLNPGSWGTGKGSFELTVNGSNFVANSVVNFNGQPRTTTFVSNTQLKVQILASDVATAGQYLVTVTNPEPGGGTSDPVNFLVADCSYLLNPTSQNFNTSGGTGSASVTTSGGCPWTATTNDSWITITTGGGTGSGTVSFTVASNAGPARTGTITVNGQTFTVTQNSGCTYSISSTSLNTPATGASGSVNVTSNSGCGWTAASNVPWITITTGASGSGNGTVTFSIASNPGPARTGTITIAGKTFTVSQDGGCTFSINPTSQNFNATGGSGNFAVSASDAGCSWTASSNASWITLTAGSGGSGNGTVSFTVATNTGAARTGTITAGGHTFTITQDSGCVYSLSATSTTAPSSGGNGSVNVTANGGCMWTAQSNNSWITITSGASGNGNGAVAFSVAQNMGPARTGTITIAGQTFTVSQDSGCTYTLSSPGTSFNAAGGSGSFNVTVSNAGCSWMAVASDSWITINSGASGTGNGVVSFTVQQNVSPARTGTINVNGRVFTINQDNGCTYSLSPQSANLPAAGGNGTFNLNTGGGCPWNVQSNATWITINGSGSGTGGAVISFTVGANAGPARSGTITAGGKTFTITQDNGCMFTLSSNSLNAPAAGASGSVNVTSSNGCLWTAASNSSWITVNSGASGSGNGTVTFSVAANTGPARTGTITIAGQTFIVNQDSGCTYLLSPPSTSVNESGGTRSFTITTVAGCLWTATSNAPWITITSGGSSTGSGTVTFSVAPNAGAERTGTITAGGQTFTVYQVSLLVRNLNDSGSGSLRQAIINANNTPGDDVIVFQTGLAGVISLTGGEITVANNGALEIRGPGANVLTISGNNNSRIFYTNHASVVAINDLTLTGGNGVGAGSDNTNKYGGAIYAFESSLSLNRVQIYGNTITVPNTRGNISEGGAVFYNAGTNHAIRNSTLSNNNSLYGGGIFNQFGALTVVNSTFSGNAARFEGGAIYNVGTITLRSVTVTANSSGGSGPSGAGISNYNGLVDLANTIVAGNIGPEISLLNGGIQSSGNNLIGKAPGDAGNTGTPLIYQISDILDTPPRLAPFGMYGGVTPTHALEPGSPAINAGNNSNASATTDQRGSARIVDGTIDIGAFEYNIEILPAGSMLPNGMIGTSYTQQFTASQVGGGNPNEQLSFSAAGVMPPGLVLTQSGVIFGTPSALGTYNFTVMASGANGMAGANQYTITVGCAYSLDATNQNLNTGGGNGFVNLTTSSGCQWSATSNVPWITITNNPPDQRTGSGPVTFTVQPNNGIARSGTITIAGLTFTVNQTSGCAYNLSSTNVSVSGVGGSNTFTVNSTAGCVWIVGSNAPWITINSGSSGTGSGAVTFSVAANTGAARSGTITAAGQIFIVNQSAGTSSPHTAYDFDGDGRADVSVFRPSNGAWYLLNSNSGFSAMQFGASTDKIVPADFDGDGKTDIAVYRAGTWYIQRSSLGFTGIAFGAPDDIPVPADFDGDGRAEVAVFRPSNGTWYIYNLTTNQFTAYQFGQIGDIPVVGDYDGDGRADVAVYRPSQGTWYLNQSTNGFTGVQFGASTDKPVPADYDGDGKTDVAVYRPNNGTWYLLESSNGFTGYQFGISTDKPVAADYDGDGKADIAVYRDGTWYLQQSRNGFTGVGFGESTDIPIPNAFIP